MPHGSSRSETCPGTNAYLFYSKTRDLGYIASAIGGECGNERMFKRSGSLEYIFATCDIGDMSRNVRLLSVQIDSCVGNTVLGVREINHCMILRYKCRVTGHTYSLYTKLSSPLVRVETG